MATTRSEQVLDQRKQTLTPTRLAGPQHVQFNTVKAKQDTRCADNARCSQPSGAYETMPANADARRRRRRGPAGGGAVGMSQLGRQRGVRWGKVHARQRDADKNRGRVVWRRHGQNRCLKESGILQALCSSKYLSACTHESWI